MEKLGQALKQAEPTPAEQLSSKQSHDVHEDLTGMVKSIQDSLELQKLTIQQNKLELNQKLNEISENISKKIETIVSKEMSKVMDYVDSEVKLVYTRIDELAKKLDELQQYTQKEFDPEVTVVAIGVKQEPNEIPTRVASQIIGEGMKLNGVQIVRAARLAGRDGKPGIMKIEFPSVQEKIRVLQNKQNLQKSRWNRVYLRSSKMHVERVNDLNMKTILGLIPGGEKYMVSGSGKIIEKTNKPAAKVQVTSAQETLTSDASAISSGERNSATSISSPIQYSYASSFSRPASGIQDHATRANQLTSSIEVSPGDALLNEMTATVSQHSTSSTSTPATFTFEHPFNRPDLPRGDALLYQPSTTELPHDAPSSKTIVTSSYQLRRREGNGNKSDT